MAAASGDQPILIVTGPPGVGKTTAAGILAARSPRAVHLEADAFFRFIRSDYVEPWKPESREQNEVVMRIVAAAASGYATADYFTIVDGIVIPGWFLEPLRDAFRAAGYAVAYAVLRAPPPVCAARVNEREGAPLADRDAIAQLWDSFADLGELESNVVDAAVGGPEETAERLARGLSEGSLSLAI